MKRLFVNLALSLTVWLLAIPAQATIVYRTIGGNCIDSSRKEVIFGYDEYSYPIYGVGPKVCPDNAAFAELRLSDSYIPGTSFFDSFYGPEDDIVESFYFSDGINGIGYSRGYPVALDFGWIQGTMPASSLGSGSVDMMLYTSRLSLGGTSLYTEGSLGTQCALGSIEGPYQDGGICNSNGMYFYESATTFDGWMRIPEPPTYLLIAFALFLLAVSNSHRDRRA